MDCRRISFVDQEDLDALDAEARDAIVGFAEGGGGAEAAASLSELLADRFEVHWETALAASTDAVAEMDLFFRSCLLPYREHATEWEVPEVQLLVGDLEHAIRILEAIECIDRATEPEPPWLPRERVRELISEPSQRLLAYMLAAAVANEDWIEVERLLGTIQEAVMANIGCLLASDDAHDRFLSMGASASGKVACGTEYWVEPLVIASDILADAGRPGRAADAVRSTVAWLARFDRRDIANVEAAGVRSDMFLRLAELADALDARAKKRKAISLEGKELK